MNNTQQHETSGSLRKNFTMNEETARELDFLANFLNKKQSQIIQDLIHKESEKLRNQQRLKDLKDIKGVFSGMIRDEQSIQSMKSEHQL